MNEPVTAVDERDEAEQEESTAELKHISEVRLEGDGIAARLWNSLSNEERKDR